jgi:hypothetical protein
MANLGPEYDSEKCDEGFVPECKCPSCEFRRLRDVVMAGFQEEENAINKRMEELAKLY